MRLPEFLTRLSPVGETLTDIAGETEHLSAAVEEQNRRVCVETADSQGLSLWEADYGLPQGGGEADAVRRGRIRTALGGGQTVTPAYLRELCISLGGFDRVEVTEDFAQWAAMVSGVTENRLPPDDGAVREAIARLCPAHLTLQVQARGDVNTTPTLVNAALSGSVLIQLWG